MRRFLIKLGAIATLALPLATVISCGAQEIHYNVEIDNAKNYNYIITATDQKTLQPIAFVRAAKHKRVWDIIAPTNTQANQLDDLFGITGIHQLLNFGIKKGQRFRNGLERLIYDLVRAQAHQKDLTLESGIGKMVVPNAQLKTRETRIAYLRSAAFFPAFQKAFGEFGLLKLTNDQYQYVTVDETMISQIITAMTQK